MADRLPANPKAGVTPKPPSLLLQSTAPNRKSHSQETAQQQSERRTIHPRLQATRGGKKASRRWSFAVSPRASYTIRRINSPVANHYPELFIKFGSPIEQGLRWCFRTDLETPKPSEKTVVIFPSNYSVSWIFSKINKLVRIVL